LTSGLKSSGTSPRSRPGRGGRKGASGGRRQRGAPFGVLDVILAGFAAALLGALAIWWNLGHGYILYYGDAQAHLVNARRMVDSRTPGLDQLGTVWLPLPHLLMLPFIKVEGWWRTGLAGSIPSGGCFVPAAAFLYAAVRRVVDSRAAAAAAVLMFALNPNVLYLQSIPMTESCYFAGFFALLYAMAWYAQSGSVWAVLLAGAASNAASLTRYEGWFLIPFATLFFALAGKRRRILMGVVFGGVASAAPLAWLAHNWWYYGDALAFYRGPYSAMAIYRRALDAGMDKYPGDHDWGKAWGQFRAAAQLCAGGALAVLGVAGIAAALWKRAFWAVGFLVLPVVFYMWSIYSSGTPIFVPELWPHSYYNTRYGLAALPLLVICAAALAALVPPGIRGVAAVLLAGVAAIPWIAYPRAESWICWKESQVNSEARRQWTAEAAAYLKANYRRGEGIYSSLGDLAGIYREAGIPLREVLQEGNNPHWDAVKQRPDLFLWENWAVAISGDDVSTTLVKSGRRGPRYVCVKMITVKGGPAIEIYRRDSETDENTLHQGAWRKE